MTTTWQCVGTGQPGITPPGSKEGVLGYGSRFQQDQSFSLRSALGSGSLGLDAEYPFGVSFPGKTVAQAVGEIEFWLETACCVTNTVFCCQSRSQSSRFLVICISDFSQNTGISPIKLAYTTQTWSWAGDGLSSVLRKLSVDSSSITVPGRQGLDETVKEQQSTIGRAI